MKNKYTQDERQFLDIAAIQLFANLAVPDDDWKLDATALYCYAAAKVLLAERRKQGVTA